MCIYTHTYAHAYIVYIYIHTYIHYTHTYTHQAPIKLVFPRDWSAPVGQQFSMLGLGDIVIPGLFIALLLRWDVTRATVRVCLHTCMCLYVYVQAAGKKITEGSKIYF